VFVFGKVGDDEIEFIQVFARKSLIAITRRHDLVAEFAQDLLQH
jgi:hypothetical protein